MKIINFNYIKTPLWKSWKKEYIDDLNIQITSLWNHLMYKNPPYTMLNSVSQNSIDLEELEYRYQLTTKEGKPIHLYIPSRLQYHQGFYNNSNFGDALLGYIKDGVCRPLTEGSFVSFNESKLKELNDFKIIVEKPNFKTGHCCISNVQPVGINDETSPLRHQLSSYLIYPLSVGSFYSLYSSASSLYASYDKNDSDQFISKIYFSLNGISRYHINNTLPNFIGNGLWSWLNISSSDSNKFQITDMSGVLWSGVNNIVTDIYDNESNELIICDSYHKIDPVVNDEVLLHRVSVTTNLEQNNKYVVHVY